MKIEKIKVGVIGLNPDSQWASKSHLPALKHLSDTFEIIGVANSTHESAIKAADVLQIPTAYEDADALIASDDIELVVITVKVPYHYDLVKAALEAGKHVYCEHPLGNGFAETEQLAAIAARENVVAAVGTQMVVSPEVIYLEQLIKDGYVGRVLSTTLIGSGGRWSDEAISADYYLYDKTNGATMLTIPLGHTLAGITQVLGGFDTLTAKMTNNFTTVKLTDTGEIKPKTTEDQILVIGQLKNGAAISIHYRGGISKGTNLLWEINGTEGDIQVTGSLGHGQFVPLTIRGAKGKDKELQPLLIPNEMFEGLPDDPVIRNVAQVYKRVAADIRNKTKTAPSFKDAVVLGKLIDEIEQSSKVNCASLKQKGEIQHLSSKKESNRLKFGEVNEIGACGRFGVYHPPRSFPTSSFRDGLFKGGDRIEASNRNLTLFSHSQLSLCKKKKARKE